MTKLHKLFHGKYGNIISAKMQDRSQSHWFSRLNRAFSHSSKFSLYKINRFCWVEPFGYLFFTEKVRGWGGFERIRYVPAELILGCLRMCKDIS